MRFHDHNRGATLIFITGCLWGSIGLLIRLMSDADASAAISFLRMAFAFVILAIFTVARPDISAFRVSGRTSLVSAAPGRVCHGVYSVFYIDDSDPLVVSTYTYLVAAVFLGIFLKPWTRPVHITPAILGLGFLHALIPTVVAYLLYYRGLQQIEESGKVPVLASMETVVAAMLGMLVFGEELRLVHYLGIAAVMVSIVMISGGDARISQLLSPKEISASNPTPVASRSKT